MWLDIPTGRQYFRTPVSGQRAHRRRHEGADRKQFTAGTLGLAITEGMLINDTAETLHCLREPGQLSVGVAIDDFGVRCACVSHIAGRPINGS
jgi:EAL domain-containing protein (putative c-di-GMP-specific phosphodiesterase class I)